MDKDTEDKMKVSIIHENCDLEKQNIKSLPYSAYVTEYVVEGKTQYDIAMGGKPSDVFDHYYDTYKKEFKDMRQCEGRVPPARWNVAPPAPKKKKRRRRVEESDE